MLLTILLAAAMSVATAHSNNSSTYKRISNKCLAKDFPLPNATSHGKDFSFYSVPRVRSARTCAVECATQATCIGFEYMKDSNTCVFANECELKNLWNDDANCHTEYIEARMTGNDSVCDMMNIPRNVTNELKLQAVYNFKKGIFNLVNMSLHPVVTVGVDFTSEGAEFSTNNYMNVVNTSQSPSALSESLGYNQTWTVWTRFKLTPISNDLPHTYSNIILFSTYNCQNAYVKNNLQLSGSYGQLRLMMETKDGHAKATRTENTAAIFNLTDHWYNLAVTFDMNRFILYVDEKLISERQNPPYDHFGYQQDYSSNCLSIAKVDSYNKGSGVMQCLGIAYSLLTTGQLENMFNDYC